MIEELTVNKNYTFIPVYFGNEKLPQNKPESYSAEYGGGFKINVGDEFNKDSKERGVPCVDIYCNDKFLFSWKPEGVFDINNLHGQKISVLLKQ